MASNLNPIFLQRISAKFKISRRRLLKGNKFKFIHGIIVLSSKRRTRREIYPFLMHVQIKVNLYHAFSENSYKTMISQVDNKLFKSFMFLSLMNASENFEKVD